MHMYAQPENIDLCIQRFKLSTITLETLEGEVTLKTGEGGLMGGPFVAQLFRGTFTRPLAKWKYALQTLDTTATNLTARWRDLSADVGGCTYADD
eukprot:8508109-Pyramimonas_sp.AAC.1